jgi:hypothetical protein
MAWYNRLGSAIVGGVQHLGQAVHHGVDSAVRLVDRVAPKVEKVANTIGRGAAVVGKIATAAIPFTAEIPVVGEVVGAVAAGAKAVQGISKGVVAGAKFAERAADVVKTIERGAFNDASKIGKMGKDFMANPNLGDAKRYRNDINSIVRHNTDNIRDATRHFDRIRGGKP